MTTDWRIRRNLALATAVSVWLATVLGRTLELIRWPWLWVLAPYWGAVLGLAFYVAAHALIRLAVVSFFRLLLWAHRRRAERDFREFARAAEAEFLRGRGITVDRKPPRS